jgi:hypothetical protein
VVGGVVRGGGDGVGVVLDAGVGWGEFVDGGHCSVVVLGCLLLCACVLVFRMGWNWVCRCCRVPREAGRWELGSGVGELVPFYAKRGSVRGIGVFHTKAGSI